MKKDQYENLTDIKLEEYFLTSLLEGIKDYSFIMSFIKEEDFYEQKYGKLFSALKAQWDSKMIVDVSMISNEALKEVAEWLLKNKTVGEFDISEVQARRLKRLSNLRHAYDKGKDLVNALSKPTPKEVTEGIARKIYELTLSEENQSRKIDFTDPETVETMFNELTKKRIGIEIPIPELKEIYGIITGGELLVFGAPQNFGKTLFTMKCAYEWQKNFPVLVYSLDTSVETWSIKYACMIARESYFNIKAGNLANEKAYKIASSALGHRIILPKEKPLKIDVLVENIRFYIKRHNPGVVIVDYLQKLYVKPSGEQFNNVTFAINALHALSQEFNIPFLVLSQLNRENSQRMPNVYDLKGSGDIEQAGTNVLLGGRLFNKEGKSVCNVFTTGKVKDNGDNIETRCLWFNFNTLEYETIIPDQELLHGFLHGDKIRSKF